MSRRTDQRRAAAFALYQKAVTDRELDDVLDKDASAFTRALAHAADDYAEELDAIIGRHARGWSIDRIAPLEKAILRIALLEMLHPDAVDVLFIDDQPSDLQLPSSVELEVTETEPGVRGDTASGGGNKPATLETGATIQVPLFVDVGDRV